jgi:hypothetical protein
LETSENSAFIPRARIAAVAIQERHVAIQEQAASEDPMRAHAIVEDATPVSRQTTKVPKPSPAVREVSSSVTEVTPLLPSDLPGYDLLPVASAEIVLEARALMYRSVAKLLLEEAFPMASKDLLVAASCGSSARAGWQLFDLCVIAVQCRALFPDSDGIDAAQGVELIVMRYLSAGSFTTPWQHKRKAVVVTEEAAGCAAKRSKVVAAAAFDYDVDMDFDFVLDLSSVI